MAKYNVTVSNVSHLVVEAETENEAREKASKLLTEYSFDTKLEVEENAIGWEVTDVEEREGTTPSYFVEDVPVYSRK